VRERMSTTHGRRQESQRSSPIPWADICAVADAGCLVREYFEIHLKARKRSKTKWRSEKGAAQTDIGESPNADQPGNRDSRSRIGIFTAIRWPQRCSIPNYSEQSCGTLSELLVGIFLHD
jgi:hypothetical protein